MNYDALVEKLMNHFAGSAFAGEVSAAKHEFFDRAGILDEMAFDFEMKMSFSGIEIANNRIRRN